MRGTVRPRTGVVGALMAAFALIGAACGGGGPSAAPSGPTKQACLIIGGDGITDHGFNQSAWEGAKAASGRVGWKAKYVFIPQASDAVAAITAYTRQSCALIVPVSFLYTDQTKQAAGQYPKQNFAIVDVSYQPSLSNVRALVFDSAQSSYLAGYLAAGMSQTGVVGVYGGLKIPPVTLFMDGYAEGVAKYNSVHSKNVKLLGWNVATQDGTFVGNFTDVAKGKQIAEALMQQSADVIFGLGGSPDFGAAQAISSEGAGKVMMIWPNTDGCVVQAQYCQIFLTSVLKGVSTVVDRAVADTAAGKFTGGTFLGTLNNHGVGLAPYHQFDSKVSSGLKKEITDLNDQISKGQLKVTSVSIPQ